MGSIVLARLSTTTMSTGPAGPTWSSRPETPPAMWFRSKQNKIIFLLIILIILLSQAYSGGYLEGWVTSELLYLQYQNTIGREGFGKIKHFF